MNESNVTRETFMFLPVWQEVLFYVLAAISTALFVVGVARLARRYWVARKQGWRFRAGYAAREIATHENIRRSAGWVGWAHFAVFYGFVVLFIGTTILAINDHITSPLGWDFWQGAFYNWYSLFLDVFGFALLIGLIALGVRRMRHPQRLDYTRADGREPSAKRRQYRADDWVFFWSLMGIGATGFVLEALRIAIEQPPFSAWSPIGWALGMLLAKLGITWSWLYVTLWWVHALIALSFIAAIPFTKAMHILTGPSSMAGGREDSVRSLVADPELGYAHITDLRPEHRLELDACTKCGACHDVCPARATGLPLSPRDVVLDLREAQSLHSTEQLAPGVVTPASMWSCMQCAACVQVCPVGVEQAPMINLLRRNLVDQGELPESLQTLLETVYTSGNSFGENKRARAKWAKSLDEPIPDARKQPVDVLWFVGDFASLDPRNQRNTKALAALLRRAGIDVGILYDAEKNAGNDVRRIGEEGLFRSLAEENIATINGCEFNRILTSDPHSFNTLRNEYPELGAEWTSDQVVHHSVFLLELLKSGALEVTNPVVKTATYHDPCTLGRYNGIFDEPREVMEMCGVEIVEMPRNRENSFCCGAGGGRIWINDRLPVGQPRPSELRIEEAVALNGVETFIVACPKDVSMYEDAIKTSGHADDISLLELSEIVALATNTEIEQEKVLEKG